MGDRFQRKKPPRYSSIVGDILLHSPCGEILNAIQTIIVTIAIMATIAMVAFPLRGDIECNAGII